MNPGAPNKRLRFRQRMVLSRMRRWGYLFEKEVLTEKKPAPAAPATQTTATTETTDTALQQTPPTDTATPEVPPATDTAPPRTDTSPPPETTTTT
jgi:hypothetical protein